MLQAMFSQPSQPYAFLHPATCKHFSVPGFCNYFKKHLKRVSGVDISPGKLRCVLHSVCHVSCIGYTRGTGQSLTCESEHRHIFVMERMSGDAVAGPSNEGAASVSCLSIAVPCFSDDVCTTGNDASTS